MKLQYIRLQPRDAEGDPPEQLQDVLVFGQLSDEEPEWYIGYWRADVDRAPVWCLTDTSVPPLEFHRVFLWAEMPPDPHGPLPMRAAA